MRAFSLPFGDIAATVPRLRRHFQSAFRSHERILKRVPALAFLAGIRGLVKQVGTVATYQQMPR